ncbi:MAG: GNAT family N-acetyltransferase [Gemmatimonadaceae bacterium]
MDAIETPRLVLRRLTEEDAPFINVLLNQPSFIENIGDRGVRSTDDAVNYLRQGPMASYARHGFGLLLTSLRADGTPIGICGILKRDTLEDPDIGYALIPEFWGAGYAREAAEAVIDEARRLFNFRRIVATTSLDNVSSIRVLEKMGFRFDGVIRMTPEGGESRFFVRDYESGAGQVRVAKAEDVPVLVALMSAFYAESDFPLPVEAATRTFDALIGDPSLGRVFVMEVGGRPAGFGVLTVAFSMEYGGLRGFVDDFFVAPEFRRLGLGAAALQAMEHDARAMGVRALLVETGHDNPRALSVYGRHGFVDTGHMLMTKPLATPVHES